MTRLLGAWLVTLLAAACTGESLSAGSTAPPKEAAPAPVPTTRATLGVLIDAFAMDGTNLYFTAEDGSLYRLAKAGTSLPEVVCPAATPGSAYTGGLALDDTNLYWTALGDGSLSGAVLTVPKAGGSPTPIAMQQQRPTAIAVDDTNVYWANQGVPALLSNSLDGMNMIMPVPSIMSAPKRGGAGTLLVPNPDTPDALTLDATGVIWHELQAIRRVPKAGGEATIVTTAAIPWASSNLVVSGDTLYWAANQSGWLLEAAPLAGGATSTIATIEPPGAILVDGSSIFWNSAEGALVGEIEAQPVTGAPPAETAPGDFVSKSIGEVAKFLLADATAFYWIESSETPSLTVAIRTVARQ
jgi:hypothetical protein